MTVIVDMEPNSNKLEAALSRISLRFRGMEQEANRVNTSVNKLNNVKLDATSATSELQKLNNTIASTTSSVEARFSNMTRNIQRAFAGLTAVAFGGVLTKGILDAANSVTILENKIALVTGRNAELAVTKDLLYEISRNSKVSVEGTITTFNKLGMSLKDANIPMKDLLKATDSVQKALAIVGGPADSANAAIFQLGQALSSGTLRGEELNSVLEQAPRIATAISDELGVSIGALRGIAAEGKITSEVVFKSLLNQAEKINSEFLLVNSTLKDSKQVFSDSFTAVLAEVNKGMGLSAGIADNFDLINNYLVKIKPNMLGLGFTIKAALVNPIKDTIMVLTGFGNIAVAIFKRIADAQLVIILPMRTFADDVSLIFNYVLVGAVTNFINSLLKVRATLLSFVDAGVANAFVELTNASNASELKKALDGIAVSIGLMGNQWFNVYNKVEKSVRSTNIALLKAGIYMGLIDQQLIRFRQPSFETLSKSASVATFYLRELLTASIADPMNNLWVAVAQMSIQKFSRVVEGAANSYRSFLQAVTGRDLDFGASNIVKLADGIRNVGNSLGSWLIITMYSEFISSVTTQLGQQVRYMAQQLNLISMIKITYSEFLSGIFSLTGQLAKNLPRVLEDFRSSLVDNNKWILQNTIMATIRDFPYSSVADLYEDIATRVFVTLASTISSLFDNLFQLTNITIFKNLSQVFLDLSENVELLKENLQNFNIEGFYDLYKLVSSSDGLTEYMSRIKDSISSLGDASLSQTLEKIKSFTNQVERAFFWVYDRVVGRSWWPDTMEGIVNSARENLQKADKIVKDFTKSTENNFRNIYKKTPTKIGGSLLSDLKTSFSLGIAYILQGINGLNSAVSALSEDTGKLIAVAVLAGFTSFLAPSKLGVLYNLLFVGLLADLTSRVLQYAGEDLLDSGTIGALFAPLGDQLGKIVAESLTNLPALVEFIGQISTDFVNAFLENFGLIGDFIISIKNLIPGSSLLDFVLFGASMSLLTGKFQLFQTLINGTLAVLLGTSIGGFGMEKDKNVGGLLGSIIFGGNARIIIGGLIAVTTILGTLTGALNTFSPIITMATGIGILGLALFGGKDFLSILKSVLVKSIALMASFFGESKGLDILGSLLPKDGNAIKDYFAKNMPNLASFFKQDRTGKGVMALDFIDNAFDPAMFKGKIDNLKNYFKNINWADVKSSKTSTFLVDLLGLMNPGQFFSEFSGLFTKIKGKATELGKTSKIFGTEGFLGRILFGKWGKLVVLAGAILAIMATTASAATGLESTMSTVSAGLEYGLIGVAIFGLLGFKGIRSALLDVTKLIASTLYGAGGITASVASASKLNLVASIINIKEIVPLLGLGDKKGGIIGRVLFGAGKGVLGTVGSTIKTIGSAIGTVFTFLGGVGTLFAAGAIGLLGVWLFGPGDGLFDSFSKLWTMVEDWWTGTTSATRQARKELEGLLKFEKVGTIKIDIKSQLDALNLGALNEDDLSSIRRSMVLANSIYERNQSIYENEGSLTRAQLREVKLATNNVEATIKRLPGYQADETKTAELVNQQVFKAFADTGVTSQQTQGVQREPDNSFLSLTLGTNVVRLFEDAARTLQRYGSPGGVAPLTEDIVSQRMSQNGPMTANDFSDSFKQIMPGVVKDIIAATGGDMPLSEITAPGMASTSNRTPRVLAEEFSPGIIKRAQEAAVDYAAALARASKDRNIYNEQDRRYIEDQISAQRVALALAVARLRIAESISTDQEDYLKSLDGVAARATSLGSKDILGASDLQGVPDRLIEDLRQSLDVFDTSFLDAKKQIWQEYVTKTGEDITFPEFESINTDLANAFNVKSLMQAVTAKGVLSETELRSLFGLEDAALKAAAAASAANLAETLSTATSNSLSLLNDRLSKAGLDIKLDYFPEDDSVYVMGERYLTYLEAANRVVTGTKESFLTQEDLKFKVVMELGGAEDKLKLLSDLGVAIPDINKALTLDPSTISRIIDASAALYELQKSSFSSMVGAEAAGYSRSAAITAAANFINNLINGIDNNPEVEATLVKLNERLSQVGADFQLDFIPEENYELFNNALLRVQGAVNRYNNTGAKIDFINKEKLIAEFFDTFAPVEDRVAKIKDQISSVLDITATGRSIDDILLLDPAAITRLAQLGVLIANIMAIIQSANVTGLDTSMRVALGEKVRGMIREFESIAGGSTKEGTNKDKSSGGAAAKTWWEGFKEALSSMDLSIDEKVLASINASAIDSLTSASAKYKAAQDAINKSTKDQVELRRQSLEIMRQERQLAINSLDNGTFGAAKAKASMMNSSIDESTLAYMNKAQLASKAAIEQRVQSLVEERDAMTAGSAEQVRATFQLQGLAWSLEGLQESAMMLPDAFTAMKDSFQSAIAAFLKGEVSFKSVLTSMLDTFTNSIIDSFAKTMTDKLFGNIFANMFGGGGGGGNILNLFKAAGPAVAAATGGYISGPGGPTSDSIMAMLSNGEYVVNAATTKRWLPFLETLNANDGRLPAFASGGSVGPSNPSALKALQKDNKNKQQQVFNINVTGDVSMQARKEIARMIPEITAGVNMTNRERGSR